MRRLCLYYLTIRKKLLFSIDGLAKIDDVANEVEELIKK